MAEQNEPFVRLARKFFRSDLWQEPREFSYAEAWLDMIQSAALAPEATLIEGECISLRRGEMFAPIRYLGQRWGWSKSKVQRFLENLRKAGRIESGNGTLSSVIRLCKYEDYNHPMQNHGTDNGPPWDSCGTPVGHPLNPPSVSPSHSPSVPPSRNPLKGEESGKGNTRASALERSQRLAEANARLGIIRPKLEAVYRRKPLDVWTFAEMSALCEISKRQNAVEECEELLEFRNKPKSFFPKFLLRLLEDWTSTLDRARTYEPETQEPLKPLSILDLKTIVQLKEDKAKALKEKYSTEGPVSLEWADQVKRSEWVKLRQEIRKLKDQIERRA